MNRFNLEITKNNEGETIGPNEVRMHLSNVSVAGPLGERMREVFEVEMMQGEQAPDENGGIHYHFELSDEKIVMLRQWLTLAFFMPEAN